MNIQNINSGGGPSNRRDLARVDKGHLDQTVPNAPHSASKGSANVDPSLPTNLKELSMQFEKIADVRIEVVEGATQKLENGGYNQRQVAVDTAKALLGL